MYETELKFIQPENAHGSILSVLQFNNDHSHIAIYNNAWVVVHKNKITVLVFKEALQALKSLPDTPLEYRPYTKFQQNKLTCVKT